MSNNIIKAGNTRLLPPDMRLLKLFGDNTEAVPEDAPELFTAEEIKVLYDEAAGFLNEARQESEALVIRSRVEAEEIVSTAKDEASEIRQTAFDEGISQGRADGYAAALEETKAALKVLLDEGQTEVDKTIAEVYSERDRLLDEVEPRVVRLSLDVAEKIIGIELSENDQAFISLVRAALNTIQTEERVTIRVNAEQHLKSFEGKAETLIRTAHGTVEADVVSDPKMETEGKCFIETELGNVDASVDAQLEQISRNLGFE